jgi:hypothetical protein
MRLSQNIDINIDNYKRYELRLKEITDEINNISNEDVASRDIVEILKLSKEAEVISDALKRWLDSLIK